MVRAVLVVAAACGAAGVGGCEVEERVVSARGGLYGLPGAQGGYETSGQRQRRTYQDILEAQRRGQREAEERRRAEGLEDPGYLRDLGPDGEVVLVSRSPRELIYHLNQTLVADEHELLLEQVISEELKRAYRARGLDESEAVAWLERNEEAVREFLATLPMGEATPGVLQENIGRNKFRLRSPAARTLGLEYESLDVVIEGYAFRLLLIS